jgi:hypothetical protein
MITLTLSAVTAYSRQAITFKSVCDAWLPTFRCVKTSPGSRPMITFAGTRESAHPIQRYSGDCERVQMEFGEVGRGSTIQGPASTRRKRKREFEEGPFRIAFYWGCSACGKLVGRGSHVICSVQLWLTCCLCSRRKNEGSLSSRSCAHFLREDKIVRWIESVLVHVQGAFAQAPRSSAGQRHS